MAKFDWKKVIGWAVAAAVVVGVVWHNALEVSKSNAHKIMGFVPLTGKLASAGISEGRGVEIVVDDWNQKGKVLEWTIKRSIEKDNTIVVEWFFKCEFEGNIDGFDGVTIADFDKEGKINRLCEFQSKPDHYYPYGE